MVGRALLGHSQVVARVSRVDDRVLLGHCLVVSRVFGVIARIFLGCLK